MARLASAMAADSFVQEESPAELLSLCSRELAARWIDDMERHSSVTRLEPVRSKKPLAAWPEERIVNGGGNARWFWDGRLSLLVASSERNFRSPFRAPFHSAASERSFRGPVDCAA